MGECDVNSDAQGLVTHGLCVDCAHHLFAEMGVPLREYIERLWCWYDPLADSHFTSDARKHFYERFWEMYCAKGFSNASLQLRAINGKGPDFCAELSGLRICVEANVPGPGAGAEGVPNITPGVAQESPEKEIILRLRNGLEEKLKQWKKWKESGTVSKDDAYIVAFN